VRISACGAAASRQNRGSLLTAPPNPSASTVPSATAPKVFRAPAWARYFSLLGTLAVGGASALVLAASIVLLFQRSWGAGAFVAAVAIFMAGLTGYVLRDLRGKWGLRVELLPDRMVLDLPAGRSLIHRPVAQHLTIPYADIDAVETRLEAYPSLGMESVQRAYVLARKQGDRIFLFEDRAIGTLLETPMVANIAAAIAARAHVPLRDLGMVEGRGGFLSVWGTHGPDWAAPSLPLAQQLRIWRHAAATGGLAIAILIVALVVRLAIGP
jgi:hypothetical protein